MKRACTTWAPVLIVGLLGVGCRTARPDHGAGVTKQEPMNQTDKPAQAEAKPDPFAPPRDVKALLALRELSRRQIIDRLALTPRDVEGDVSYQKLKSVERLGRAKGARTPAFPGYFYLRGESLTLVYIGDDAFLSSLTPEAIRKELGGEGTRLASRAGKRANQFVYPKEGFAYSETAGALDFVEIFPPMTLQAYHDTIYEEVGPFIR